MIEEIKQRPGIVEWMGIANLTRFSKNLLRIAIVVGNFVTLGCGTGPVKAKQDPVQIRQGGLAIELPKKPIVAELRFHSGDALTSKHLSYIRKLFSRTFLSKGLRISAGGDGSVDLIIDVFVCGFELSRPNAKKGGSGGRMGHRLQAKACFWSHRHQCLIGMTRQFESSTSKLDFDSSSTAEEYFQHLADVREVISIPARFVRPDSDGLITIESIETDRPSVFFSFLRGPHPPRQKRVRLLPSLPELKAPISHSHLNLDGLVCTDLFHKGFEMVRTGSVTPTAQLSYTTTPNGMVYTIGQEGFHLQATLQIKSQNQDFSRTLSVETPGSFKMGTLGTIMGGKLTEAYRRSQWPTEMLAFLNQLPSTK